MKERLLITIVFMAILFPYSYYKPTVKEEVSDYITSYKGNATEHKEVERVVEYITISDWKGWRDSHDYKLWK